MPDAFLVFVTVAMVAMLASFVVMLRSQARGFAVLRDRHPAEWERLGKPSPWARGLRVPTTYEWREHRALTDAELDRACERFRRDAMMSLALTATVFAGLLFW